MKLHRIGIAAASVFFFAASLAAQASHTWVSATGNDSTGNGTTAKPYASFQEAVNNTAAGGMVSVLGPGDYGAVSITQAVTIDGTGGGSIAFTGSEGIYIDAPITASVVLRNLVVNGVGTGIDAIFGESFLNLTIDGCLLEGYTDIGIGVGSTSAENVLIRNTVIVGGTLGVRTFQSAGEVPYDQVTLDHVTIQGVNQTSGLGGSAAIFTRNGKFDISNSNVTQSNIGIQADTDANINMANSILTDNTIAICTYSGSTATLNNTSLYDNAATTNSSCSGQIEGSVSNEGPSPKTGGDGSKSAIPPDPQPVRPPRARR